MRRKLTDRNGDANLLPTPKGVARPASKSPSRLRISAKGSASFTYETPISRPSNPYRFTMGHWCICRGATLGRQLTREGMVAEFCSHGWRDRKVQEWLLLLLRFAITRDPSDQSAALGIADELDSLGLRWRPGSPSFFLRTSHQVCEAILAVGGGHRDAVLHRTAAG